jgi:membrane protease YdiL (CAAX protease family)
MKPRKRPLSPLRHPLRWIGALWQEIHDETLDRARTSWDYRPLVVLLTVAVSLTLQEYYGDRGFFRQWSVLPASIRTGPDWELWSFVWWTGWRVLGFVVLPALVVVCMPGERLRDYGLRTAGFFRHLWIYVALFLAVLPLVIYMSTTKEFQRIYPFYKLANRSTFDLVAWEVLYAIQFLSLEFFFRGFMLHGTKRSLGVHSIWVMIVPYCMIHYGKTFSETMGAIVAGVILGTIALRTRSIWGGVFIHVAVALTMDLLTVGYLRPPPPR